MLKLILVQFILMAKLFIMYSFKAISFIIRFAILSTVFFLFLPFYFGNYCMPFSGFEVDYWLDNMGKSTINSYNTLGNYSLQSGRLFEFNFYSNRLGSKNFFNLPSFNRDEFLSMKTEIVSRVMLADHVYTDLEQWEASPNAPELLVQDSFDPRSFYFIHIEVFILRFLYIKYLFIIIIFIQS